MKKPRNKKEFAESILDLLYMKEPDEAEFLLSIIYDSKANGIVEYSAIYADELEIIRGLMTMPLDHLKKGYQLAVLVYDATQCD